MSVCKQQINTSPTGMQCPAGAGIESSVGGKGDCHYVALAETIIGLHKAA